LRARLLLGDTRHLLTIINSSLSSNVVVGSRSRRRRRRRRLLVDASTRHTALQLRKVDLADGGEEGLALFLGEADLLGSRLAGAVGALVR